MPMTVMIRGVMPWFGLGGVGVGEERFRRWGFVRFGSLLLLLLFIRTVTLFLFQQGTKLTPDSLRENSCPFSGAAFEPFLERPFLLVRSLYLLY